jgi:hypothetical protein
MCRFGENRKNQCQNKWFDPEFELIDTLDSETDLIIKNANFDDHMGLYTCQICCHQQCQTLTSFVYPVRDFFLFNKLILLFLGWIKQVKHELFFFFSI